MKYFLNNIYSEYCSEKQLKERKGTRRGRAYDAYYKNDHFRTAEKDLGLLVDTWALAQVDQKCVGVSVLSDLQKVSGHCSGQPSTGVHA